jgi:lipopolysaccharide/colanic/teichoic acid biosynthesis glycosyltransferase
MIYRLAKRIMDILGAFLGLLFTAIIYVPVALAIKLDSRGPVFFAQERVGKNAKPFKCYKFRTMYENSSGHELKPGPDDERVTRVGRFLRSTSLDEMPQFFNILRGEMSLVGPRPIIQAEVRHYDRDFELYASVPPGLTGLWQVSGRNNVHYPERVHLDVYYVRHRSTWLDLTILIKTPWIVLKRDGAY